MERERDILVVDDQAGIRLLLQDILVNEGYRVTTAQTGMEAMDLLHTTMFDAIILDYKLPVLNGVEVLKRMEKDGLHIPAIMITGMKEALLTEIAGVDADIKVLAKPFNVEEVCTLMQSMLAKED